VTSYLRDTPPSFYDIEAGWCCTIGAFECEMEARAITKYCQENGDRWQSVPVEHIPHWVLGGRRDRETVEMPEEWLALLQRVRVRLEGPPELIRSDKAKGGLQLRYPHGRIWAAAHDFSAEEMERFRSELTLRWADAL